MAEKANLQQDLDNVNTDISKHEAEKALGAAIERLHDNPDFQLVILHEYFAVEAERIFDTLLNPSNMKRDQMTNVGDKIASIRDLKTFFMTKMLSANEADGNLLDAKSTREIIEGELDG